jgi:site-specific DNA-methyltransferase (adenine-specific)
MEKLQFICADCAEFLYSSKIRADIVVTSPPYNMGTKYESYHDDLSEDRYCWWLHSVAKLLYKRTINNAQFFLNLGYNASDPLFPFRAINRIITETRWSCLNVIQWVKSIAINDRTYGHIKPINSDRFLSVGHEYIFQFVKNKKTVLDRKAVGVPYTDKSNIKRWGGKDLRCRGNVWFVPYETIQEKRPHPAEFPPVLAEMCIKLSGLKGLVLDPFCGAGNTGLACKQTGHDFIGIDIDPEYIKLAKERVCGRS